MRILDKIEPLLIKTVIGVHIHLLKSEEIDVNYVQLSLIKGNLELTDSGCNLASLNELSERLKKGSPIWIGLSGRGIISKKTTDQEHSKLINHLLPNARAEDFMLTSILTTNQECFVDAIRKEKLEEITEALEKSGFPVIGYSLGASYIEPLVNHQVIKEKSLNLPYYKISILNSSVKEIEKYDVPNTSKVTVADDELNSKLILPFALAYNKLTGAFTPTPKSVYSESYENVLYNSLKRFTIFGGIGLIFVILLVNFFVFSSTHTKVNDLKQAMSIHKVFYSKRDSLRKEVSEKTILINESGLGLNTRFSFYADRIAYTLPPGITLMEISVFPINNKIKAEAPIRFGENLVIKGSAKGSVVLNEWIKKLEEFEWISNIVIVSYSMIEDKGVFEIEIHL